jgi:pyruvate kinase
VPVIAKLERPEAIERLAEIVAAADAVMVARGDLGLEMPLELVPQVQKQVLRMARARGIPVIVATQVLESMRTEFRPTRAEVSDAAGAVDAGADAIMLSGETAIGQNPPWALQPPESESPDHVPPLCDAAVTLAGRAGVDAIVAVTRQGRTARLLSMRRPSAPIYAITGQPEVARRLQLWRGVAPIVDSLGADVDTLVSRAVAGLRERAALPTPATVVVVSANPDLSQTRANFLRVRRF